MDKGSGASRTVVVDEGGGSAVHQRLGIYARGRSRPAAAAAQVTAGEERRRAERLDCDRVAAEVGGIFGEGLGRPATWAGSCHSLVEAGCPPRERGESRVARAERPVIEQRLNCVCGRRGLVRLSVFQPII